MLDLRQKFKEIFWLAVLIIFEWFGLLIVFNIAQGDVGPLVVIRFVNGIIRGMWW